MPLLEDAALATVADDLRRGRTTPTEYVDACRSRTGAVDDDLRAFVDERGREDRLREAAAAVEADGDDPAGRPALYGVPVGVKDVVRVDGLPTRAGSELHPSELAGPEAAAVRRLREAGAVVLGKPVTAEFACFAPGPTRNPHDRDHTPGGSSSGSAAAVAAGCCPLALGTQTVGSVIRPAAFCGVVGVVPSRGRLPTDGVVPVSPTLDRVGLFAQNPAGARLAAAVLVEEWRPVAPPRERPTLAVPEGPYLDRADQTGLAAFADHVDRLADAGYEVRRVSAFDDFDGVERRHEELMAAEAAVVHEPWYSSYGDRYAPATADLVGRGRELSTRAIGRGQESRDGLRDSLSEAASDAGIDLWVSPAAPGPAPAGIDDTGDPVMNLPWTHAGLPTATVPAGTTDGGLPLGLQCAAAPGADEDLLAWLDGIAAALRD